MQEPRRSGTGPLAPTEGDSWSLPTKPGSPACAPRLGDEGDATPLLAPPLVAVDLRHTGAALSRAQPFHGAVGVLPGVLSMFAMGVPADPAAGAAVGSQLAQVNAVLAEHAVGQSLNMVEGPVVTRQVYPPATYRRLQRVRARYDPEERMRANHPVPLRG